MVALRRVLDQLENLGPVNDRAGRRRDGLADLERRAVDHRRHAVVVEHVAGHVGQPAADTDTAGVEHALERGGIGDEGVGRRHGLPDQDPREARPLAVQAREAEIVDEAVDPGAAVEIALHRRLEQGVLLPRRIGKSLIALLRRDLRPADADPDQLLAEAGRVPHQRARVPHRQLTEEPQGADALAEAEDSERGWS